MRQTRGRGDARIRSVVTVAVVVLVIWVGCAGAANGRGSNAASETRVIASGISSVSELFLTALQQGSLLARDKTSTFQFVAQPDTLTLASVVADAAHVRSSASNIGSFLSVGFGAHARAQGTQLDPVSLCPPELASIPRTLCSPIAVSGLIPIANTESFVVGRGTVVLSPLLVHLIWTGNVTMWDDPRILKLNKLVDIVPGIPIRLVLHAEFVVSYMLEALEGVLAVGGAENLDWGPGPMATAAFVRSSSAAALTKTMGTVGGFTVVTSDRYYRGFQSFPSVVLLTGNGDLVQFSPHSLQVAASTFRAESEWSVMVSGVAGGWPLSYMEWGITFTHAPTESALACHVLDVSLRGLQAMLDSAVVEVKAGEFGHAVVPEESALSYLVRLENTTCGAEPIARPNNVLTLAGGSTPIALFNSFFEQYRVINGLRVRYEAIGTGAARGRLLDDSIVAAGADGVLPDSVLLPTNRPTLEILPVAASGLAIVFGMPLKDDAPASLPNLILTRELLADIFLNKVKLWSDPAILALNPVRAPYITNTTICLFVRARSSGLTEVFTRGLSSFSPEWAHLFGVSSNPPIWPGEGQPNACVMRWDSNLDLALAVATARSAIGYVSVEVAAMLDLDQVQLINRVGESVLPTPLAMSAALNGSFSQTPPIPSQPFVRLFIDSPAPDAWPLVFYSFFVTDPVRPGAGGCADLITWAELFYWMLTSEAGTIFPDAHQFSPLDRETREAVVARMTEWRCDGAPVIDLCKLGDKPCLAAETESPSPSAALILGIVLPIVAIALIVVAAVVWWRVSRDVVFKVKAEKDVVIDVEELVIGMRVGGGSFGTVFAGTWRSTPVAVKRFHNIRDNDLKSFVDEASVLLRLRHPNVILFMGILLEPACLVTEFVPNGSLYGVLHSFDYCIPRSTILWWMHSLAVAMDFLHGAGILHRDLKSLNVLLDAGWVIRVCDFGLSSVKDASRKKMSQKKKTRGKRRLAQVAPSESVASMMGSTTATMATTTMTTAGMGTTTLSYSDDADSGGIGSLLWLAPEVLEYGSGAASEASDMYAFAVTAWEMLTRSDPYAGHSPVTVALEVVLGQMRPNVNLVPEWAVGLRTILVDGWAQNPKDRPTFGELTSQLALLYEPEAVEIPSRPSVISGYTIALWVTILDVPRDLCVLEEVKGVEAVLVSFTETLDAAVAETSAIMADRSFNDALVLCRVWGQVLDLLDFLRAALTDAVATKLRVVVASGEMDTVPGHSVPNELYGKLAMQGPLADELSHWASAPSAIYILSSGLGSVRSLAASARYMDSWSGSILFTGDEVGVAMLKPTAERALEKAERCLVWGEANAREPAQTGTQFSLWSRVSSVPALVGDGGTVDGVPESPHFPLSVLTPVEMSALLADAERMGTGSCASLYRASFKDRAVLVKVLVEQSLSPVAVARLTGSVAMSACLSHSIGGTVAGAIAICTIAPFIGLVTEFHSNGSLADYIRRSESPRNGATKRAIALGIADALTHLHSHDVAHGGVKPTNVLLVDPMTSAGGPQVMLSDVGQSHIKTCLSTMKISISVAYCSVEELSGSPPSMPSDIFALASVIFELVTGTQAFAAPNLLATGSKIMDLDTPNLETAGISPKLALLLNSCWTADPVARPNIDLVRRHIVSSDDSDFSIVRPGLQVPHTPRSVLVTPRTPRS